MPNLIEPAILSRHCVHDFELQRFLTNQGTTTWYLLGPDGSVITQGDRSTIFS